ncbi:MAG: translation elongation factor-like protein [Patescibacteria group bacterium]|nr:translation elongation factor-like protein [Patescibacteria group bacterium]
MKKKTKKTKKAAKPKKKAVKAKKKTVRKVPKVPKPIGTVTHFYNEISVAIVKFKEPVLLGANLHFKGATTDFEHSVKSMQLDHKPILKAPKGKLVGIKVKKRVREGDLVLK